MFTMQASTVHGIAIEAPMLDRMREGKEGGGKGPLVSNDQSLTLATANDQVLCTEGVVGAITANMTGAAGTPGYNETEFIRPTASMQVRRLTPTECCRLQGFPDDYLDITYRGKPAADGPKYKALGNSWAVPVVRYIGERIQTVSK